MRDDKQKQRRKLRKRHLAEAAQKATKKALETALKPLLKRYGKETFMTVGATGRAEDITAISTGYQDIDDILTGETDKRGNTKAGTGIGLPRGRIVEIFGPEGSGKTTLTLHIIAQAQRSGGTCAFVDVEHALAVPYAAKLGVRMDELLLTQPNDGEQALDIVRDLARTKKIDLIVVDSVAALEPKIEQTKKTGEVTMGRQAAMMSRALRGLAATCAKTNTLLIFTNQIRQKIGVLWGNPETTPGGNALKFYASIRLDIRKVKQLKNKAKKPHGHRARIRVLKNKVAPPFREVHVDVMPNKGVAAVYADPDFLDGD